MDVVEVAHAIVGSPGEEVFALGETVVVAFALLITENLFFVTDCPEQGRIVDFNAFLAVKVH